ncbi:MAG: class I SAM-dependent methyltransferase [Chloroflexi bacterium]|nr:class I SAM-dependent methyltransferase [Chloroflexota bacterium]
MNANIGWESGTSNVKLAALRWAVAGAALDLGCGRGWYAAALADRGFAVTGMDQANRVEDARVRVIEGPIRPPLPFPDCAFTTVLMFDILEHLEPEAEILAEVARVCAPGGRVIVSVPHADDAFLPDYGLTYLHRIDRTHVREYTPRQLAARLESFGFRTLYCRLEGQARLPLVFAEFLRGPRWLKTLAQYAITALQKIGVVHAPQVAGDIHWAGERAP